MQLFKSSLVQAAIDPSDRRIYIGMAVTFVVLVVVGAIPPRGGYEAGFNCPAVIKAPF